MGYILFFLNDKFFIDLDEEKAYVVCDENGLPNQKNSEVVQSGFLKDGLGKGLAKLILQAYKKRNEV